MTEAIEELCGKMTLTEGESVGLTISEDDTADLRVHSGRCLVGKLLSDRLIQREAFRSLMSKLWRTVGKLVFKEMLENLWLIEFSSELDKQRVLKGRLWLFDRSVLVLKDVDEGIPHSRMVFASSPFWVQMHEMLLVCMSREIG
jgi:hypothetical protein